DLGAGLDVGSVDEGGRLAGAALDEHLVTELGDARARLRRGGHAALAEYRFFGDPDLQARWGGCIRPRSPHRLNHARQRVHAILCRMRARLLLGLVGLLAVAVAVPLASRADVTTPTPTPTPTKAHLAAGAVPRVLLVEWRKAENRTGCAPVWFDD